MKEKLNALKQKWIELLQNPKYQKIRIKDAANILNVSEAELLSTTIGENTHFLNIQDWSQLFKHISSLGLMMYLIRNDYAVHENTISIDSIICKGDNIILSNENSKFV